MITEFKEKRKNFKELTQMAALVVTNSIAQAVQSGH